MKNIILLFSTIVLFLGSGSAQTATFSITTNGTNTEIEEAIDYATNIWGQYLKSNIPIKIHVNYVQIPGFLGVSISNSRKNFTNAPMQDVWYPSCLANAMSNTELNPGESDMEIAISGTANWYFGTDGNPASNQQDFVSVFLHEVCHSLGIVSLANKKNSVGSFGQVSPLDLGISPSSFMFNDLESLPGIFDFYLINGAGKQLIDTLEYPNGSAQLGSQLTSNNLFFDGDSTKLAFNGIAPKIYAPTAFTLGSSCSHFDENTFNNTENSLMTPFSAAGDVQHDPGPIVLGALYDIGWNQYDHPPSSVVDRTGKFTTVQVFPNPFEDKTTWKFSLTEKSTVQLLILNGLGQVVSGSRLASLNVGDHQLDWNGEELSPGIYFYRLQINDQLKTGSIIKN